MSSGAGRAGNSALRFALELATLTALGVWGWQAGSDQPVRLAVSVGAPLLAATAWGQLVAPRAPRDIGSLGRLVVEAVVFGAAALALIELGRSRLAEGFALLAALNTVLVHAWGQDLEARAVAADRHTAAVLQ